MATYRLQRSPREQLSRQGLCRATMRMGSPRARKHPLLLQPLSQSGDALAPGGRRLQAEIAGRKARIGHVVALIAGAPVGIDGLDRTPNHILDVGHELFQADRIRRASAEIEGASLYGPDMLPGRGIGLDSVGDVEDVAHLASVAVDGDRLSLERLDQEMGHPALILGSHLA